MRSLVLFLVIASTTWGSSFSIATATEAVQHDIQVWLYPETHRFVARDTVTLPDSFSETPTFFLHRGLSPSSTTPGVVIARHKDAKDDAFPEYYDVTLAQGVRTFTMAYEGVIHHPLEMFGKERARGFKQTPGIISEEGVFLGGSSFWYPAFENALVRFTVDITLPAHWNAVCQGKRTRHDRTGEQTRVRWASRHPHEDLHIIAAPFTEYIRQTGEVTTMVFLRKPDEGLARKYLDATDQYVSMYAALIGPYPYEKFALVENFWETGYGMASFTLLGPTIIRFPFILHSSYPHEILHNWWGNSVFPIFGMGNWSEGITAYLADHLMKEMRGKGTAHRQQVLQKYNDYVLAGRDFPLTAFRSRHSSSSEAVGYGKAMMLFHMLRQQLGNTTFTQGLKAFYADNRFQWASYKHLQESFEKVSHQNLGTFFRQWTTRLGAPKLSIGKTQVRQENDGFNLEMTIEQQQEGAPYLLQIPVAVTLEGRDDAIQRIAVMEKKRLETRWALPGKPIRIDVDPEFDVFRKLHRKETPAALTQALGARDMLVVLPAAAPPAFLEAYSVLAETLGDSGPDNIEIVLDSETQRLPTDRSVVLLGWENTYRDLVISSLSGFDVSVNDKQMHIGPTVISRRDHAVVMTGRQRDNADAPLTWVTSDLVEALPGLGRKLPHYQKYSYLGFRGSEPENIAKGRWPVIDSPMTVFLPHGDGAVTKVERGKLKPRKPLASLPEVFPKHRKMETVRF